MHICVWEFVGPQGVILLLNDHVDMYCSNVCTTGSEVLFPFTLQILSSLRVLLTLSLVMEACSAGARHLPRLMSDGPAPLRDSPTSKGSSTADATHMSSSESEMSAVSRMAELDQFLSTPQDFSAILVPGEAKEQKTTNNFDVWPFETLKWNDPISLFKSCETLALLIRNERLIMQENFACCVHAVRTFAEASSTREAIQYDQSQSATPISPPGGVPGTKFKGQRSSSLCEAAADALIQWRAVVCGQHHPTAGLAAHTVHASDGDIQRQGYRCVCVRACVRACMCVTLCLSTLYILYCPSFLSPSLSGGASQAPAVRKDVTLSSLYFPEADKQTSSTGQLWYTAWCPLLQVRGGGWGGEGRE